MTGDLPRLSSDEALAALRDLAAQGLDEEQISRALLDLTLQAADPDVADAVRACAVPGWFDAAHLAVLTEMDEEEAAVLVEQIAEFSFVLPHKDGGYTYHEATRERLLDWWRKPENRQRYAERAERLARSYLALAQKLDPRINGPDYREALAVLDDARPNLAAAWQRAGEVGNSELVRSLAYAIYAYFMHRLVTQWITWTEKGLEACQRLGDGAGAATMQNNLGNAYSYLRMGDPVPTLARTVAIGFFEEALRFRTPEAAPLDCAQKQTNLGNAYAGLGDYERAIACYTEALRFYTPEAAPLDYAQTQTNLGNAHAGLGDYERAIDCYTEALRFYTLEDAPLDYAATGFYLSSACFLIRLYWRAFEAFVQALAIVVWMYFGTLLARLRLLFQKKPRP